MNDDARADLVGTLRESLVRLTGRDLAEGLDLSHGLDHAVRHAPYVLVAHDTAPDPVFVYGNDTALSLFELDWDAFTSLPSRLSAEPVERDERERLLHRVAEHGYIDDYRGVRVSSTGRRFVIEDAVVWDVVDHDGAVRGQAALFDRWTPLDEHHTPDWERRHDLGWSAPSDGLADEALAATVAAASSLPHHELAHADLAHTDLAHTEHPSSLTTSSESWTQVYAAAEPAVGEHAHTAVSLDEDPLTVVRSPLRVVDDRVDISDDPVSGVRTRERVRTFLTYGPKGTTSDLSVGYDVDAPPEVRPLTRDELDVVLGWATEEGWNPGRSDAAALWAADPDGLWGVEVDGVLVGAGTTLRQGDRHGVVGLLLVDPQHRHEGIGALTFPFLVDGALSRLSPGASLSLHCPVEHQDFCERFGFQLVRHVARATATGTMGRRGPYAGQLRTLRLLPFDKVVAYDARHVGGERPDFVRAWMAPEGGHGLGCYEAGEMIGFAVMRPAVDGFRIGPLYADEPDIAEDLVVALSGAALGERITLDIPLDNPDAVALAGRHGFTQTRAAVALNLGEVPPAARDHVYAETTLEF